MCAVLLHIDAFDVLTIDISAQMRTLDNNKAAFACLACFVRKCRSEEPGTDYQIIVMGHWAFFNDLRQYKVRVSVVPPINLRHIVSGESR